MLTMNPDFWTQMMIPALVQTLQMTFISAAISTVLGFLLAVLLIMTGPNEMRPNKFAYPVLSSS